MSETLVDATKGCVNHHIMRTMRPTRPGLSEAVRMRDILARSIGAKFDGCKARRRVVVPENERGAVSIMRPGGLFRANAVCTFGVVSSWGNWARLASAVRRWALKLVGNNDFFLLLFSRDALFLAESEIFGESSLISFPF